MRKFLAPSVRGLAKPQVLTGGVSYLMRGHSLRLCLKAKPRPAGPAPLLSALRTFSPLTGKSALKEGGETLMHILNKD